MTTTAENSVLIALADVIDLERARARRQAEARAAAENEARRGEEETAQRARAEAEATARRAREAGERAARAEAERAAAAEREERFQAQMAERVARIAADGEREVQALRDAWAARPRRARRSWITAIAVSACLLMVGAVGCLVGTTLQGASQPELAPLVQAPSEAAPAPTPVTPAEGLAWASALLQPTEADATLRAGWAFTPSRATRRPRPVVTPAVTTPTVSCAQLGPLGCLRD